MESQPVRCQRHQVWYDFDDSHVILKCPWCVFKLRQPTNMIMACLVFQKVLAFSTWSSSDSVAIVTKWLYVTLFATYNNAVECKLSFRFRTTKYDHKLRPRSLLKSEMKLGCRKDIHIHTYTWDFCLCFILKVPKWQPLCYQDHVTLNYDSCSSNIMIFAPYLIPCHWRAVLLPCLAPYWRLTLNKCVLIGVSERTVTSSC